MIFISYYPLNILTLQFCKCVSESISESIIARGLKLYQFMGDDEVIIWFSYMLSDGL